MLHAVEGAPLLPRQHHEIHRPVHRAVQLIRTDFHDDTWLSFWRGVVDGQPPAFVAQDLGISRNAVYLAKARVLSRLREEVEDLLEL